MCFIIFEFLYTKIEQITDKISIYYKKYAKKNELYYKIKQLTKDKFNMYLPKIDTFLL